ncbi:MAG: KH domain-containing protein [Desulfosarcina sp.]
MKELIELIARALVDQPEAVFVNEINGSYTSIVELRVAKEDIGKIIGKRGRTADALRTLVNAISSKAKKRLWLEIID